VINVLRAFRTGLTDGLTSPWDMSVGMTYGGPDDKRQIAWDYGANLGQRLGRKWANRPAPIAAITKLWKEPPGDR
jgi:hypothetical protein